MYVKGRSFVLACGLVKAHEGHGFVYLHLLCQGFENIAKAMLLAEDYDKYDPQLKSVYHHNLDKLLCELKSIYGHDVLSREATEEVILLNDFYKKQKLRYGNSNDFASDASGFCANHLHRELVELLGVWNRRFELGGIYA